MTAGRGLGAFSLSTATLAPYGTLQAPRVPVPRGSFLSSPQAVQTRGASRVGLACRLYVWGERGCASATWGTRPGGAGLQEQAAGARSVGVNEKAEKSQRSLRFSGQGEGTLSIGSKEAERLNPSLRGWPLRSPSAGHPGGTWGHTGSVSVARLGAGKRPSPSSKTTDKEGRKTL